MDKGIVIQEIKNLEVRLWSEKTQKEKEDSLQGSYESELVSYASISLKQNDVQELRDIWGSWKNNWKQKALVQLWNPGYSCFTFNQEDMVPTIEEYTTLLHCESIKLERAYIKHIKSQSFKNRLTKIAGVDEKWVTDRLRNKGNGQGIEWIHIRKLMNDHPDEWKTINLFYTRSVWLDHLSEDFDAAVVELFEQLPKRVNPAPTILAETFRSLNHCRRAGGGRFIGCVQLLQFWMHNYFWKNNGVAYRRFSITYSPLREFITMKWHEGTSKEKHYGARQFVPATCGLAKSEFEYHGDSYKKRIKEIVDSWKKVLRMDIVAAKDMLPRLFRKDRADKLEREQKRVRLELEDLRKGYQDKVKDNSKLKVASKYWNERTWKEQMKTAQRRLAGTELEAIVDGFKKQAIKLQIVPFDGCLQWHFRWEQVQQRVKARDAVFRDFLDQVQKAARHLHELTKEVGMVRKGIQPVTDEDRRLVNLLEAIRGLEDLVRIFSPDNTSSTSRRRDRWLSINNFPISEPISTSQRKILDSRQHKLNFTTKGRLTVNKQLLNFRVNFNFTAKDIGLETTQVQIHDEGTAGCQQITSQFQSQFQLHSERYWTPDNASSTSRRRDRWLSTNNFPIAEPILTSQRRILDSRQHKFNFTTKGPLVVNKQLLNFRANFNFTTKDIGLQLHDEGTAGCQQTISQFRSQFQLHNEGYWTPDNASSTSRRRDHWLSINNFSISEPISTSQRMILDSRQRKFNFTTKGPLVVNKQLPNFRANFNFTAKDIGLETMQVQLQNEGTAGCQQTISQFRSQFQLHSEGYWTRDNTSSTSQRRDDWLSTNNFPIPEPISTSRRRILDSEQSYLDFNFTTNDIQFQAQLHDEGATRGFNFTTKGIVHTSIIHL
ncbi:hypothetical protein F3Y22_tig00008146pilonHSYRG00039 [Hibiscus syriacus]|uniref:DUF7745 domain-containing protein n=1 Tax=Hibiscus syriacus TaxID=106335 RepID=A0A6A3CES1_HIBSY|nr:hypothetical protein F3Y22_tig00008146pilonHSYRG00039 [Hibiscus syriacus]